MTQTITTSDLPALETHELSYIITSALTEENYALAIDALDELLGRTDHELELGKVWAPLAAKSGPRAEALLDRISEADYLARKNS